MIGLSFILGIIFTFILVHVVFPIKCPKCNKKCEKKYYITGLEDSAYYNCEEHGDINNLN